MKRILSMLLAVLMIVTALPMMMFAADETIDPFIDVKADRWYTEAVMWCYANGYMTGTSENTFEPSTVMNRAMFVTVLAAVAGVDTSAVEYTGKFTDVAEGKWYTGAIEWAAAMGIASGISDDVFGRNNSVTRETIVLMSYQFMKTQGVDVEKNVDTDILALYGDADRVHDWALTAMAWAATNEIISGTGTVEGTPQLSPRATATRAEVAVIVKAMLSLNLGGDTPVGSFKLNGTDISDYTIVYGETHKGEKSALEIAEKLQDIIAKATGVEVPVVSDDELAPSSDAYEILIGRTNREESYVIVEETEPEDTTESGDAGDPAPASDEPVEMDPEVTLDREGLTDDDYFYEMQGTYLILASNEINAGTYLAMTRFCEDNLGYTYFGNGFESFTSIKSVDIADGTRLADGLGLDLVINYQMGGWDNFFSPGDVSYNFALMVHSIPILCCDGSDYSGSSPIDYSHHIMHYMDGDPCLSDPENIKNAIKNVKLAAENHPGAELIWVTQSDGSSYCKCKACTAFYTVWGRCATYVHFLNILGEAVAEVNPNAKVVSLAYKYTIMPPKTVDEVDDKKYNDFVEKWGEHFGEFLPDKDLSAPDNAIMMICTDNSCFSHALDDPKCDTTAHKNTRFSKYFETWCELFDEIYIWDYLNGDSYMHSPFPNVYEIWQNYNYYYRMGVTGMYGLGITGEDYSDFSELRTYLVGILNADPDMSWNEYSAKVDAFLKVCYGKGWTYVRAYIDEMERLSDENCWWIWTFNDWNQVLTEEQWAENYDYLFGLLEKALAFAETEQQQKEVKQVMIQLRYVELQMAFHKYEASGDQADLDAFRALNEQYTVYMAEVGFAMPDNWGPNGNPDGWNG